MIGVVAVTAAADAVPVVNDDVAAIGLPSTGKSGPRMSPVAEVASEAEDAEEGDSRVSNRPPLEIPGAVKRRRGRRGRRRMKGGVG